MKGRERKNKNGDAPSPKSAAGAVDATAILEQLREMKFRMDDLQQSQDQGSASNQENASILQQLGDMKKVIGELQQNQLTNVTSQATLDPVRSTISFASSPKFSQLPNSYSSQTIPSMQSSPSLLLNNSSPAVFNINENGLDQSQHVINSLRSKVIELTYKLEMELKERRKAEQRVTELNIQLEEAWRGLKETQSVLREVQHATDSLTKKRDERVAELHKILSENQSLETKIFEVERQKLTIENSYRSSLLTAESKCQVNFYDYLYI
jgi:hypothetical protein